MANRFANGRKAFGFCDVCGFRFDLKKLKNLVVKTKQTQIKACPQCWTPDQPQLQLGMYPVADPQALRDPRPDTNTWYQSGTNGLQTDTVSGTGPLQEGFPGEGMLVIQWGWNPIGGARDFDAVLTPNTLVGVGEVGQFAGFVNTPYVSGPDPYFANVQLLLHMDGPNGSTSFTDLSPVARTVTPFGAAQVDSNVFKFTSSQPGSLICGGSGDYLSFPLISIPTSTAWTFEAWFNPSVNGFFNRGVGGTALNLGVRQTTQSGATKLLLGALAGPSISATSGIAVYPGTWYFVAACNDPVTGTKIYLDGIQCFSDIPKQILSNAISYVSTLSFNGYIDEVRVTSGVARYSGNFTPPTAPFPNY